jgi:hypothetical protein
MRSRLSTKRAACSTPREVATREREDPHHLDPYNLQLVRAATDGRIAGQHHPTAAAGVAEERRVSEPLLVDPVHIEQGSHLVTGGPDGIGYQMPSQAAIDQELERHDLCRGHCNPQRIFEIPRRDLEVRRDLSDAIPRLPPGHGVFETCSPPHEQRASAGLVGADPQEVPLAVGKHELGSQPVVGVGDAPQVVAHHLAEDALPIDNPGEAGELLCSVVVQRRPVSEVVEDDGPQPAGCARTGSSVCNGWKGGR